MKTHEAGNRISPEIVEMIQKYKEQKISYRRIAERITQETGVYVSKATARKYGCDMRPSLEDSIDSIQRRGPIRLIVSDDPHTVAVSDDGRMTIRRTPVRLECGRYGYRIHTPETGAILCKHKDDAAFFRALGRRIGWHKVIRRQAA